MWFLDGKLSDGRHSLGGLTPSHVPSPTLGTRGRSSKGEQLPAACPRSLLNGECARSVGPVGACVEVCVVTLERT